jgi:hypothetical protein
MPKAKKKNPAHYTLRWIAVHAPSFVRRDSGGKGERVAAEAALKAAGLSHSALCVDAYLLGAEKARDTINEYLKPVWAALKRIVG